MKTLYIHGLDSYPVPEKTQIMKDAGLKVVALHLNYREKLGIYETLKDAAVRKKAEFIIGSSLGGYIGYWLAEDLGLPCLLFNPAMHYDDVFYSKIPDIENLQCPSRYVVLGARDKTQKINGVVKMLKSEEREDLKQRILTCEWLGHEIDLHTFNEMVTWAVQSIKLNSNSSK